MSGARAAALGLLLATSAAATPAARTAPELAEALRPTTVGHAGAVAPAGVAERSTPRWQRDVYWVEVADEGGRPLDHPLLGGFNLPRPQLVDIDGDGDDDLFVQEYSGAVMFFERLGHPRAGAADSPPGGGSDGVVKDAGAARGSIVATPQPGGPPPGARFRWRTDRFLDLDVGEWYLFVDIDGDGDLDLFGEERFSKVRFFRNDGGPGEIAMALVAEELRTTDGEALFSDRQNIPKVADLDCDGALDLFVGKVEGTVSRYEMSGLDERGAPLFRHLADRFEGIEIIGQVLGVPGVGGIRPRTRTALHGANTMALEDWDGDGDLDLFWGDFFEPGLLLIDNRGSCRSPSLRTEPRPFPPGAPIRTSGYNAPAFGDVDGDGDRDLLVGVLGGAFNPNDTSVDNLLWLERAGPRSFVERTRRFLRQLDVGSESVPAFADIDGDGDQDLFLGNKIEPGDTHAGRLFLYENVGDAHHPRLQARGALEGFDTAYHYAPAFADLDADGDLDMVLGTWGDEVRWVRNDGDAHAPSWAFVDEPLATLTRGRNATPALGDVDGDGDADLFVGESSGELNFYRNVGTPRQPRFELVSDKFLGLDVGRRSAPTLVDYDGDGDLDLVIGSEAEGLLLVRNEGTRAQEQFAAGMVTLQVAVHPFATPAFADIDGDGDQDLFVGGIGGGLIGFRRETPRARPKNHLLSEEGVPSGVPDYYAARRLYAEGEILEVLAQGRRLRIGPLGPGGREVDRRPGAPDRSGVDESVLIGGGGLLVDLEKTKGWIFVDDPEGGPQRRIRLDRGRHLFTPGQIVRIGPAPGLESSASAFGASSRTASGFAVGGRATTPGLAVRGWIYVRLTPFRQQE